MPKYDLSPNGKSLGGLWKNPNKSKPHSPFYIGNLKIKARELSELLELSKSEGGHVELALAGWINRGSSKEVITLEAQVKRLPKAEYRSESADHPSTLEDFLELMEDTNDQDAI